MFNKSLTMISQQKWINLGP